MCIRDRYYDDGLRIIQVYRHQMQYLGRIISAVKARNYRFIIYMDDLSFEDFETEYKYPVSYTHLLVRSPKLFLMDEPLSNLDARLKTELREEIKRIQRELRTTTIYVTHDQEAVSYTHLIRNCTITSGSGGLTLQASANYTLDKLTVKAGDGVAIYAGSGSGVYTMSDSKLFNNSATKAAIDITGTMGSVSYTHLDVYKRQAPRQKVPRQTAPPQKKRTGKRRTRNCLKPIPFPIRCV